MAKTEVILTHNVVGLGGESDQVKVAAGYARNYLFPQGLAIPLTSANKRQLESLRRRRAEREARDLNSMSELGQTLSKVTLVIAVKTGEDGKMFGSVTAGTIADELKHQFDAALEKKKIHLPQPIKKTGDHEVELRLHHDVVVNLKVRVESTTTQPESAGAPAVAVRENARQPSPSNREAVKPAAPAPAKAEVKKERAADRKSKGKGA
jgi:large subunit ribosomal protein L9